MKKNNLLLLTFISSVIIIPEVAFAQFYTLQAMLTAIGSFGNLIIRIIFGLTLIYFFWGTAQFVLHAGDSKTREDGKQRMLWGVIAIFVMFSLYGIIQWIGVLFGIQSGGILELGQNSGSNATVTTSETFNGVYDPATNTCQNFSGQTIPCPN